MARDYRELSARINENPARQARVERYKIAIRDALALGELRESRSITQKRVLQALCACHRQTYRGSSIKMTYTFQP